MLRGSPRSIFLYPISLLPLPVSELRVSSHTAMDCLFCKFASKEITPDVVYEDDSVLAFRDINPQAPTHILVIPKKHVSSLAEAGGEDDLQSLLLAAAEIARQEGVAGTGYRVVINNGEGAGQSVFHLHVHLLGGRPMTWPPG
jgi:histidine triad (HIT) family protein